MNRGTYIEGNTVRRLDAEPVRREQSRPLRELREEEKRRKSRQNAARRNRARALYMSKSYVAFLTVCICISAFSAFSFIRLQADVTAKMRKIASLESQISNLKADNDARFNSVSTSVDLNYIKNVAINELGMSYATEDQIVYFSIENSNFMDQYSDIPEK